MASNNKVEMLARWTEMELNQGDSEDINLQRLIGKESEEQFPQPKFFYSFAPLVFDLDDVARFNRAIDPEFTVIRFYDGEGCVIKYGYKDFTNLYLQRMGGDILSCVPEGWDKKALKKKTPPKDDLLDNI